MVLAFNLEFLGFPVDRVKDENGAYSPSIFEYPHAITGARAVLNGSDYFSMMKVEQPMYLGPLGSPARWIRRTAILDAPALRRKNFERIQDDRDISSRMPQHPIHPHFQRRVLRFHSLFQMPLVRIPWGLPVELLIGLQIYGKHWYQRGQAVCANPRESRASWRERFQEY